MDFGTVAYEADRLLTKLSHPVKDAHADPNCFICNAGAQIMSKICNLTDYIFLVRAVILFLWSFEIRRNKSKSFSRHFLEYFVYI